MTSMLMKTDDLRALSTDEIDAVSGGACVTIADVVPIGKGELEIGYTECDKLPGVKLPYAKWNPKAS